MQLFKEGPIPTAKITAQQKQVKVIICLIVNIQWNDNQCTVKLTNTILKTLPTSWCPSRKINLTPVEEINILKEPVMNLGPFAA